MKDEWEQECADLRAELAVLQQQLLVLQTAQTSAQGSVPTRSRWRLSRGMMVVLLPIVVLLAAGGVLYGQGAMDALFIDKDGKVGIGTPTPSATLDVAGTLNVTQKASLASTEVKGTLDVTQKATLAETEIKGTLTTGGNVGIGAPKPNDTLDVRGRALVHSLSFTDGNGNSYADNWLGMADNVLEDKTKWLHIGGVTDGVDENKKRRIALYANTTYIDGDVGIWTKEPKARLDVNGDIKATSVNGEKPPMIFEVGQKNDTTNWHHAEQDIGALCGDADGCTMKFFLRHSLNDEVRTIAEQLYIEQPDKSNNKQPGLHGYARQGPGEDREFILQTAGQYEIVNHPWSWIWVLNYSHENVGPKSNAFGGYKVQFLTHPHVTATVIIYDR
ncbi:MAG: hypothetical protein AB7P69_05130 [Candidatus Binatia bacterium]